MRVDYDKDQLSYALANALKERNELRKVLQEIEAARWHTACELRRIATRALRSKK